jgi:aminopeptidase N
MKKLIYLLILLLSGNILFGQNSKNTTGSELCSYRKSHIQGTPIPFYEITSAPRHSYDVISYKLNLDIYNCFRLPVTSMFTASNLITFRVDSTLNSIQLNAAYEKLLIDSVKLQNGPSLSFTHGGASILTINLDRTYYPNEYVNVIVYYTHYNVTDNAFNVNSSGFVYTDCEPEGARNWFPCWDKPSDKATVDITAKVPSNVKLGSNGRLADSTVIADTIWYHWKSREPLSTYLAVITGKVNYNLDILWWHKLSNPLDSIPIRFYYSAGENILPAENAILDMTDYYSQLFGDMPFEKNGFCSVSTYPGGMENQTLTTMSRAGMDSILSYYPHEYAHQWFGDMITCGTWADIWLNESFATYVESLYNGHIGGYSAYKNHLVRYANYYLSNNPGWAIYNPPFGSLFNTAITYYKGACVLHMLRYTLGDSLFFASFKAYATDTTNFKFKCALTDDYIIKINNVTGLDLTWFMYEWVKQPNHPVYQNTFAISNLGSGYWKVRFTANQVQTNSVHHKMPIVIKVSFTSGPDTLIRVMNDANNQTYEFNFSRQPASVVFDPNNDILLKTATLSSGVNSIPGSIPDKYEMYQNYPNPFNPTTNIKYQIANKSFVTLKVFDILGKEVETLINEFQNAGTYEVGFEGRNLPSGIYYYKIQTGDFTRVKKMVLIK